MLSTRSVYVGVGGCLSTFWWIVKSGGSPGRLERQGFECCRRVIWKLSCIRRDPLIRCFGEDVGGETDRVEVIAM